MSKVLEFDKVYQNKFETLRERKEPDLMNSFIFYCSNCLTAHLKSYMILFYPNTSKFD